jgi:hypothetical protein
MLDGIRELLQMPSQAIREGQYASITAFPK